jgi:hypothetical protein
VLHYLVANYFHEDFDFVAESPIGVVREFVNSEIVEYSRELLDELTSLHDEGISEGRAKALWCKEYGAYYEPDQRDGISYLKWFDMMRELLSQSVG